MLRNENARRNWFDPAALAMFPPTKAEPGDQAKAVAEPHASQAQALDRLNRERRHADADVVHSMLRRASAAMILDIYSHLFDDQLNDVSDRTERPDAAPGVRLRSYRVLESLPTFCPSLRDKRFQNSQMHSEQSATTACFRPLTRNSKRSCKPLVAGSSPARPTI